MNFTQEQQAFIYDPETTHTKLLATAGSGKTRCIISRIDHLITTTKYQPNELLMLTFSRFTRDDFINRIISYNIKTIDEKNIKTIDSFAKALIDGVHGTQEIDVSLLSYKFMKYLETTSPTDLQKNPTLSQIKIIFVDEAQDLNETQYKIFVHMRNKLGIIINLIGDPNQNIYQFRDSSEKFLMQFEAKIMHLTQNFRSYDSVINFSKWLRPVKDVDIKGHLGPNDTLPTIACYENDHELEERIIHIVTEARNRGINFSDIAILAPTRGKMRGYGRSHGLCLISNILYNNNLKFKQFYEETTDDAYFGAKYTPQKGYLNVLTYMGSKGLEWKYVILVDADMCLINKRIFNQEKHQHDQYLLYVACSRAIENMIILSKYNFNSGNIRFNLNAHFSQVPRSYYYLDPRFDKVFNFPILRPLDLGSPEKRIIKVIDKMNEETLDKLATICSIGINPKNKKCLPIYDSIQTGDIESNLFLTKFTINFFHLLYNKKHKIPRKKYPDIENLIHSKHIVTDVPILVNEWFYNNRNHLTWESFDQDKGTLHPVIVETINNKFSRRCKLSEHTIVNDGYFKSFILSMHQPIQQNYEKYMESDDTTKLHKYLFYLIVLMYSLETQHYFHVKNKGKKFKTIIKENSWLFSQIEKFVVTNNFTFANTDVSINGWNLTGEIDIINNKNEIWELKCISDITLKHILQVLIYNILYFRYDEVPPKKPIKINFINLLKGDITTFSIRLTAKKIAEIKEIFIKNSLSG